MTTGVYKRTPEMKTGKYERTPEMKTGKYKRTPKHCAAIKDGHKESEADKANADAQCGGNDLVWHHVAYDFNDPEALRVRITRKFHGQIHSPKGQGVHKRGYSLID